MTAARMTSKQARDHLARLSLSQQGFARLIRVNPSTVRRWLDPENPLEIPRAVAIALELLTPARVKRLIAEDRDE